MQQARSFSHIDLLFFFRKKKTFTQLHHTHRLGLRKGKKKEQSAFLVRATLYH